MSLERMDIATLRRYTKPRLTQISTTQVLLELIERAEKDERLAAHLKASIHQADPDYTED
jgi:hypothetical protein